MDAPARRYRAFISYSQKDKRFARRLHRALERYRVPAGPAAERAVDGRLGRFFRDDDEMGASQSLGAALTGALDDAESLIVVCSPHAARSTWVNAEVRHFKMRRHGRVFAVIADGEPNAADPARECFPPALPFRLDASGEPTSERDEPRAPDLRREGFARVRAQLAAGLLGVPFDDLWQRDRRRARGLQLAWGALGVVLAGVMAVAGLGWQDARNSAARQAAAQALVEARAAAADGRTAEALRTLEPFATDERTRAIVEPPLAAMLGWAVGADAALKPGVVQAVRVRDALVLVEPGRLRHDLSDIGLELRRLLRSKDGRRLVAVGEQRVAVVDATTGSRLATLDTRKVQWLGHAFEAPNGLLVITGGIFGPTNGSVWPQLLTVSADGHRLEAVPVKAHMFWGSAVGVTRRCDALRVATQDKPGLWRIASLRLASTGAVPVGSAETVTLAVEGDDAMVARLAQGGPSSALGDTFTGEASRNPLLGSGCAEIASDEGERGLGREAQPGGRVPLVELGSATDAGAWTRTVVKSAPAPAAFGRCTEAQPCAVDGGAAGERYSRDTAPGSPDDRRGWLPAPVWPQAGLQLQPVFHEHLVFNSGHQLAICRPDGPSARCWLQRSSGEDQARVPLWRSADGRHLYWPFGGSVVDLAALRAVIVAQGVPRAEGSHHDFEFDRDGLTVAVDGRLVTYLPPTPGAAWSRPDDQRASSRYGVLEATSGADLLALVSLGHRQYLAVRSNGLVARLDAAQGSEAWRIAAAGLGPLRAVWPDATRQQVLIAGKRAWRVFRTDDGFPASGLIMPPALVVDGDPRPCEPEGPVPADGTLTARCGGLHFARKILPQTPTDLARALARATCLSESRGTPTELLKRCGVQ